MRRNSSIELWLALLAMVGITAVYAFVIASTHKVPAAGEFFGHSLGVLGFLLMLMTETLYSLRKRSRSASWGKMSAWLKFHIFTGLVGPFMVLLHSSWKFNGLAGAVTLLTIIVVLSGVVGRYIYTAVPRTVDGAAVEAAELEQQITATDARIQAFMASRPQTSTALAARLAALPDVSQAGMMAVLGRALIEWEYRRAWKRESGHADTQVRAQMKQIEELLQRQQVLKRQVSSLAMARRLLAVWHTVHIPIGMALFTAAFIHLAGALYFATFLR